MGKNVFFFVLALVAFFANAVDAQIWTEYARVEPEGSFYLAGDTVRVRGEVRVSDTRRTVPFSRYAYVEVMDACDSVLLRVKVRCDTTGNFRVSIPTNYAWRTDIYYIRAYTRLMQNFNPLNFPIRVLPLGKELPVEKTIDPPNQMGATIQAVTRAAEKGVRYRLAPNALLQSGCRLFAFHSGGVLEELPVPPVGKTAYFACGEGLCSFFWVDSTYVTLAEKHVWIGEADEMAARGELYSPLPFPQEADSIRQARAVGTWLATARFTRFSLQEVLRGNFRYRYPFEDKMFFGGSVSRENGKPLVGGTLVAYNTATDQVYEADIDSAGHYLIAVDDFPAGTRFYLQAHDLKGGTDRFRYVPDDETYPPVVNLLREQITARLSTTEVTYSDSVRQIDWAGWQFSLPEIIVKNHVLKAEERYSERFYQNDYKGSQEIRKKNYRSLLYILQDMPGIRVMGENATNIDGAGLSIHSEAWHIRPTRGNSTLAGAEIPVLLDGSRVELNSILHMPVEEIESVEYLKAWQALAYVAGAIDGAIFIRTRDKDTPDALPSKGCFVLPLGLSE